jgi:hypothetical protein
MQEKQQETRWLIFFLLLLTCGFDGALKTLVKISLFLVSTESNPYMTKFMPSTNEEMSGYCGIPGLDIAASSFVSAVHTASPVWSIFGVLLNTAYRAIILPVVLHWCERWSFTLREDYMPCHSSRSQSPASQRQGPISVPG